MGVKHWQGLIDWMRSTMEADGRIGPHDLDMLTLTDDIDEAIELMVRARDERKP
jgi:predicted Rossmann-fold nucleotide-binding protein